MQDGKKLQDRVLSFDPRAKRLPVDNINILLCGGVGAGKSSFVSTIDSLCEGRTSRLAPHGTGTGSLTCKLRKYTFTDPETDQLVHWKLWDSMGWGMNDYKKGSSITFWMANCLMGVTWTVPFKRKHLASKRSQVWETGSTVS